MPYQGPKVRSGLGSSFKDTKTPMNAAATLHPLNNLTPEQAFFTTDNGENSRHLHCDCVGISAPPPFHQCICTTTLDSRDLLEADCQGCASR